MDFEYNKEQKILVDAAREFIKKEVSSSLVRELLEDKKGYSPEIWKKMGELGWLGLAIDEEYGGFGGSFLDIAVLFEEIGRGVVPSPYFSTVILFALLIQDCGTKEIKEKYLPEISEGEIISTLALVGKSGVYGKNEIGLEAREAGGNYIINGSSFFVPYAHVADVILCAAKTGPDDVTLFIIDGKADGLDITSLKTITGNGTDCIINLKDVTVSPDRIVGEKGFGWEYIERLWPKIAVALSCECVGGMQKVTEMTSSYVGERIQFGKPLSALQVVQHMCVDMLIKTEVSRHTAHLAAWNISEGLESENNASIAKAWCGEAYKDVTKLAHQVTGAIGFTEEYDLQLYTRNAKKLELLFGNGAFHRDVVADRLGL